MIAAASSDTTGDMSITIWTRRTTGGRIELALGKRQMTNTISHTLEFLLRVVVVVAAAAFLLQRIPEVCMKLMTRRLHLSSADAFDSPESCEKYPRRLD
jgi:hypothetical protein